MKKKSVFAGRSQNDYLQEDISAQDNFRKRHLLHVLSTFEIRALPLDLILRDHFKGNKAVGSKDRAYIANTAYALIRNLNLIDYSLEEPITWAKRLAFYSKTDFDKLVSNNEIPLHIRACMPLELFEMLVKQYGEESALTLSETLKSEAPTTIRINPLKTERALFLEKINKHVASKNTADSPYGIICSKRIDLFGLPEFKEGLFEVQDEASQLAALLVDAKPGESVLDYCAGSGGKTLLIAARMQNKGQVYLHDVRAKPLKEAKVRLKRAGIQNAQIISDQDPKLKKLKKKFDWVLVDAPCSGTGTLRRNPDMKWKIDKTMIQRLKSEQRTIFESALSFVKDDGHIVYATCSILEDENEKQIEHFLSKYPLELVGSPFISLPKLQGMDGFFAAVFKKLSKT